MRVVRCYFVAAQADVGVGAERGDFQQAHDGDGLAAQLPKLRFSLLQHDVTNGCCSGRRRVTCLMTAVSGTSRRLSSSATCSVFMTIQAQ